MASLLKPDVWGSHVKELFFFFFKVLLIFIFRKREGRNKERERNISTREKH